jgi:hypothetical protein
MGGLSIGDGLAALAFWGFIAAIVVAGIWYSAGNRRNQHETLRRMLESGQPADRDMAERLLATSTGDANNLGRGLRVAGIVVLFVAPGIAVMGLMLRSVADWALYPLIGAAVITALAGAGLLVAARTAGD